MMKKILSILLLSLIPLGAKSTTHIILVWDGYLQFLPSTLEVELGDTIQWLPLDYPSMVHTVTSSNIPPGAVEFDVIWQAPADTFFQYIPAVPGLYEYVCTPHIQYDMVASFNVVDGTSGINEMNQSDVFVYPNPVSESLFISSIQKEVCYRVYSPSGKLILEGISFGEVDVSSLQKGTYFIELIGIRPRLYSFLKE